MFSPQQILEREPEPVARRRRSGGVLYEGKPSDSKQTQVTAARAALRVAPSHPCRTRGPGAGRTQAGRKLQPSSNYTRRVHLLPSVRTRPLISLHHAAGISQQQRWLKCWHTSRSHIPPLPARSRRRRHRRRSCHTCQVGREKHATVSTAIPSSASTWHLRRRGACTHPPRAPP